MTRRSLSTREERPVEFFANHPSGKVLRCFSPCDLSGFIVHGSMMKPFGDISKSRRAWTVAHRSTFRTVPIGYGEKGLTFREAMTLAAKMDEALPGMSEVREMPDFNGQYRDKDGNITPMIGWTPELMEIGRKVRDDFLNARRGTML